MPFGVLPRRRGPERHGVDGGTRGERTGPDSTPGRRYPLERRRTPTSGSQGQWPVGGISDGFGACLAFFAARFSFRLLPGFFTLLFCGDLSDTTVLPTISGYAHGLTTALRDRDVRNEPSNPERNWSDDHEARLPHRTDYPGRHDNPPEP